MNKLLILSILLLPLSSALQITEIELNPLGTDAGQEWIEFYSEVSLNLSEYKIINNDQQELSLFGNDSGYFLLILNAQWLDNTDEKIYLYQGNELIQETSLLEDSKNGGFTFQLCGDKWVFRQGTPQQENNCPEIEKKEILEEKINQSKDNPEQSSLPENKTFNYDNESKETNFPSKEELPPKPIHLNPQTIKTPENSSKQEQDKKPIIFFIGFCILLSILYFVQSKGKNKNEFG